MPAVTAIDNQPAAPSWLDRALALVTDVRAGEGVTALLMLVNVFLLLVCYSVIKTVREPLILLGGGAEVRSYAAAGQALLLIGFVPLYGYIASRIGRTQLIVSVTLFFVACIELFSAAVSARVPYIGVAFFVWVGIFNISLVAQFWSFANDIYLKEAGDRLFPVIMIGMTAGAPLGSFVAARLFRAGLAPQVILQVSAILLLATVGIYLLITRRTKAVARPHAHAPLAASSGFGLVMRSRYLRLIAALVVLLNVVNTTGEYIVARLLTAHVAELAAITPNFDKQAFIGAFSGDYQFWVNIAALMLQAFVTSRLIKFRGLQGVLLALPLIAFGGYSLIAAGVGFGVVRWIKTAENATDYSLMNTARQLLWLPTSREEKYKAKQAIDTFFVRAGDVLSAAVVYMGTAVLHLGPDAFAMANVVLTLAWMGVALLLLTPSGRIPAVALPRLGRASAVAATILLLVAGASSAAAQDAGSRADMLANARREKATNLHPYEPSTLERRIDFANRLLSTERTFFPFIGSVYEGGGIAAGPGVRVPFGDTGLVSAHAAWSFRNYGAVVGNVTFPEFGGGRVHVELNAQRIHAPGVAFYGFGNGSRRSDRRTFGYDETTAGATVTVTGAGSGFSGTGAASGFSRTSTAPSAASVSLGAGFDFLQSSADGASDTATLTLGSIDATYARSRVFAAFDSRTSPGYSHRGRLLRAELADYRQSRGTGYGFQRADVEVQQFVPLFNDTSVIALRATTSTTMTAAGEEVPYVLMPSLGGHDALRGYSSWRFRDRNRLLMSAEYRWMAGPLVDMALFVDAGQVAPRFGDLAVRDLRTSYGIGFSVHTPSATITRFEVARSREGLGLLVSFGPSF
jgi:AAA family ATP:ADP antiporter